MVIRERFMKRMTNNAAFKKVSVQYAQVSNKNSKIHKRGFPSVFIIRLFGHLDAWDGYF